MTNMDAKFYEYGKVTKVVYSLFRSGRDGGLELAFLDSLRLRTNLEWSLKSLNRGRT